ncbi:putative histone-lysine N-methyltransferase chromatin regulator PHD family [Arabidopsis thaliana]
MEKVVLRVHDHPLLPFERFYFGRCSGCSREGYFYGGYRCNELACFAVFHKECAESKPEISHHAHPKHLLKLGNRRQRCHLCERPVGIGYFCSICDFGMHLICAKSQPLSVQPQLSSIENYKVHEHPLKPFKTAWLAETGNCKGCNYIIGNGDSAPFYECRRCKLYIHVTCLELFFTTDAHHNSHLKHPLKYLKNGHPSYADHKCLLCGREFEDQQGQKYELYHCDVCNFSICISCQGNPPPLVVVTPKTHEHQLHLIPRLLDFTCNACGTQGDRSPYFCLQCNFMIHRGCIDLPRIININRHDHRISYICHLGHGNWRCGVCRKTVDGFYGAYSCSKCSSYVVHSLCATRKDVWDMVELEGTPEEEEIAPFEVVDENTIKHMSHDHDLIFNNDGINLHESKLCEACVSQINTDPFYSCELCGFILHQTCAYMPRKKRHVLCNIPFSLQTDDSKDSSRLRRKCSLCLQHFTGFAYNLHIAYNSRTEVMDIRCGSIFEPFVHESHPHPLYYKFFTFSAVAKCDICHITRRHLLCCEECDFRLDFRCATLPKKVMKQRYDDHPLFLSYGENNVDGEYWCDVCEKRVDAKTWFYTCDACGVTLHVSCVVGDFSYHMPGPLSTVVSEYKMVPPAVVSLYKVVPNTSICRPLCSRCHTRCKLPCILETSEDGVNVYFCSNDCHKNPWESSYY